MRVHVSRANAESKLTKVSLESHSGDAWKSEMTGGAPDPASAVADAIFKVQAAANAEATKPSFTRPTTEQPYYDVANPAWRMRSFAPWPLEAWAEFTFDGVPIKVGEVVQTLARVTGPGGHL